MGVEIEKKFLLASDAWKKLASGTTYRQGYLSTVKERTVRVRNIAKKGFLTIKGISVGARRLEYEYEIPLKDANSLLDQLCAKPLIEKTGIKSNSMALPGRLMSFSRKTKDLWLPLKNQPIHSKIF